MGMFVTASETGNDAQSLSLSAAAAAALRSGSLYNRR